MAKVKLHVRVGKLPSTANKPYRVDATVTPNNAALEDSRNRPIPTVRFAVELNISDAAFKEAEAVMAELDIEPRHVAVAAEVSE